MANRAWIKNKKFKPSIEKVVKAIPRAASHAAQDALRVNGAEAVDIIRKDAPLGRRGSIRRSVAWSFGDPPAETGFKAPKNPTKVPDDLRITIYAGGRVAPAAHLIHNGTKKRSTKSGANRGAISTPKPFFWPNIRSLRRRHKGRISRAANKAIRDSVK